VNCVLPTIIDTPENRAAMPDADPRKWVAPQDLAAVIVFLASDAARAIHGAAIPVAGLSYAPRHMPCCCKACAPPSSWG
jgi:NAD(P)-dependent dehydrogenase (short-subunit alcohol dehydrogenase family)